MIPKAKLESLAQKLLVRTHNNSAYWHAEGGPALATYKLMSGPLLFRISLTKPTAEPDYYRFEVYADSQLVGQLTAEDENEDDASNWELLSELHSEAHRVATGWDRAVDDFELQLDRGKTVGIPL